MDLREEVAARAIGDGDFCAVLFFVLGGKIGQDELEVGGRSDAEGLGVGGRGEEKGTEKNKKQCLCL